MSSTGRGAARIAADAYYTPPWVTLALLDALQADGLIPPGGFDILLDPAAGEGMILRAYKERYPSAPVAACELRAECQPALAGICGSDLVVIGDGLTAALPAWPVIANPPYSLAVGFVEHYAHAAPFSAFLLRYGFLASEKRQAMLDALPPHIIYQLPHRPKFIEGKSGDSCEYIWLVFPPAEWDSANRAGGWNWFRRLPCVPLDARKRRY